jgi:hypothetical protein
MANTLKFGNGQWATKVGSTLAYNDEGGNFKPLPFNFTRSTGGTRVNKDGLIEMVTNNKPRIDFLNDSNGALLLEPSRTNLVTYSEQFDNAYWTKLNSTITANAAVSPDGFTNADKLVEDSTTNAHQFRRDITTTAASYTFTVYAKAAERSYIFLYNTSAGYGKVFNLSTGTVGTGTVGTVTASIQSAGNGWYRCSITGTATAASNAFRIYVLSTDTTSAGYTGDGTSGLYIWGAQVEAGSYATSYIPTQGGISTRVADVCNDAGNNQVINSTEGVLYAEISALANDITQRAISLSDGTNTNRVTLLYNDASNAIRLFLQVGGATQASIITTAYTITDFHKIAVRWALNDFSLWVDGVEAGTDNLGIIFPSNTLSTLDFNFPIGGAAFYGKTKDVRVYNTALTDQELINLTTI